MTQVSKERLEEMLGAWEADERRARLGHGMNLHEMEIVSALRELLSLRQSHSTGAVGDGWKLVPTEPTKEMIDAGLRKNASNPHPWLPAVYRAVIAEAPSPVHKDGEPVGHQHRVAAWMLECFGPEITADKVERADRFVEEALELVQATGWTADRAHALVDYVFGRPVGEIGQEVGGVMVTLAALCNVFGIDMNAEAEREVDRITQPDIVLKIRAKQAAKPTGSALPAVNTTPKEAEVTVTEEMVNKYRQGIYVASKVAHAEMWRDLRDFEQEPIISTWIDEAGVGESASLEDLWRRCVQEASNAGALIVYRRSEEVLKGAWVELGAALSCGVPVFAVGIEEFTVANHKGITHCESLIEARRLARAALVAALSRKG